MKAVRARVAVQSPESEHRDESIRDSLMRMKTRFRALFPHTELGSFVEGHRISYFVEDILSTTEDRLLYGTKIECRVIFRVDDHTETLLRLRADGEITFLD